MKEPPLGGFERGETLTAGLGELRIFRRRAPPAFWVEARGIITPDLLRQDLACAERFGVENPRGWSYVADATAVRMVHPANVLELRRIPALPNLRRYVVITRSRAQRLLIASGRWLVSPDAVVATTEEALEQIA